MSQLVIEIDTPEDEALLLQLLPKLNGRVLEKKPEAPKQTLAEVLERISQTNIAEKYGDPSEWQRETRQDRPLAGREE